MLDYIHQIQRKLIKDYGFKPGDNGLPQNVPDGAYPMMIDGKLDLVIIRNGAIWCCNFINDEGGLAAFRKKTREKLAHVG